MYNRETIIVMKQPFFLLLFIFVFPIFLKAQDPLFSQFWQVPTYSNPAFTGIDGGTSVSLAYRDHWSNIPGGFKTMFLGLEHYEPCLKSALGINVLRDVEGEGALVTNSAGLNYAYTLAFDPGSNLHNLNFGLGAYWMEKTIDWDKLIFSDELDAKRGRINTTQFIPNDQLPVRFVGFNAGVSYRADFKTKRKKRNTQILAGFGVNHLFNAGINSGAIESLQGLETGLPPRYTFRFSFYHPFFTMNATKREFKVMPHFRYQIQGDISESTIGTTLSYTQFALGFFYRNTWPGGSWNNTNTLIIFAGFNFPVGDKGNLDIGATFDANMSGLRTRTGNAFEITMRYHFQHKGWLCKSRNGGSKGAMKCPKMGRKTMSTY